MSSSSPKLASAGGRARLLLALVVLAAMASLVLAPNAFAAGFWWLDTWGGSGAGPGQFSFAMGDAVYHGTVYVSDFSNNRVEMFTTDGAYLGSFGTAQLNQPRGIAVDRTQGKVYVADEVNNRIDVYNSAGAYLSSFGSAGSGAGHFQSPCSVAVDSQGNIYVGEILLGGANRVQKFDSAGGYVSTLDPTASGTPFGQISGLAVNSADELYVADISNSRVMEFSSGGTFVRQWTVTSVCGVAVDRKDRVLVTDHYNSRLTLFSASGTQLDWTTGSAATPFNYPDGVCVDGAGNIYVADWYGRHLQKLGYDDTPPVLTTNADGEWHSLPFDVTMSATDDLSGVATGTFKWSTNGGANWFAGKVYHQAAPADHSADGVHTVLAGVKDMAQNWNSPYTKFRAKVDTRAPVTQLSGETLWWVNTEVTLTFIGSDVGAGVAETEYSTDSGTTWTPVSASGQVTFSTEGTTEIWYRSVDACVDTANVEDYKSTWTYIDKTAPITHALNNITIKKGTTATFKFNVADNLSDRCLMNLVIKKGTKTMKNVALGVRPSPNTLTPATLLKKYRVTLAAGTYTWYVTAYDYAGNFAKSTAKKLVVK